MNVSERKEFKRMLGLVRKELRKENTKWPATPVVVPADQWPRACREVDYPPVAVWRSRDFLILIYHGDPIEASALSAAPGAWPTHRITVCRTELDKRGRYCDQISWDDLQCLKGLVGFGESYAVEVFPAAGDVVNVQNMRHLWVFASPLAWAWRQKVTALDGPVCQALPEVCPGTE